jgi:DNA-3-methyladenine glycosylase I
MRCTWAQNDEWNMKYHDKEWGIPSHDDRYLFEMLILEGAQAGLKWTTILKKREDYRKAFKNFDIKKVAKMTKKEEETLLQNTGIIRNKLKIKSAIRNARVFVEIQKEFGTFAKYLWAFVNDKPIINKHKSTTDIPTSTHLSDTISKDLKKRGMKFVGSTIIYAYMQAIGLINDHQVNCFRYKQKKLNKQSHPKIH